MAAVSPPLTAASRVASSVSGSLPGVMTTRGQHSDPGSCLPAASAGSKPACSSEDLPAPDAPETMIMAGPASRPASLTINSAVSR